jgi:Transcription factor WhiB
LLAALADLPAERPRWHAEAACKGAGVDLFYPAVAGRGASAEVARAAIAEYCNHCPVKVECSVAADEAGEIFGVWGGTRRHKGRTRAGRPQPSSEAPKARRTAHRRLWDDGGTQRASATC